MGDFSGFGYGVIINLHHGLNLDSVLAAWLLLAPWPECHWLLSRALLRGQDMGRQIPALGWHLGRLTAGYPLAARSCSKR